MLTKEKLCEVLQYDETTGEFYRNLKKGKKKAGTIHGRYISILIGKKLYYAHRLVWLMHNGEYPDKKLHIDHIDGNGFNNTISNLRLVTVSQNLQNIGGSCNKLGLLGAYKTGNKFISFICVNKKRSYLGCYDTPEQANAAYLRKKSEIHPYANMDRLLNHTQN